MFRTFFIHPLVIIGVLGIQEQFCFGEEITTEVTSFKTLAVNITRNSSTCNASINLTLSFDDNNTTFCKFMHSLCHIALLWMLVLWTMKLEIIINVFSVPLDFTERCAFKASHLDTICTIDVNNTNKGFEKDTVPGVVSLEQKNTSFCNQTETEVVIYKCECRYLFFGKHLPSCQILSLHIIL